jgi:tetratricopeptide (TPR) repeat protein
MTNLLPLALLWAVTASPIQAEREPLASLAQAMGAAESRLQAGDLPGAESLYRGALFEGLVLLGTLERLDGRVEEARRNLGRASAFVPDDPRAALSLASAQLQAGDAAEAVAVLRAHPPPGARDLETTRVLARAQASAGRTEEALKTLEEGAAAAPDDPEAAFVIAGEYLWLKKTEAAERLFARVVATRPLALTHVLIGRAYRDAGEYDRARQSLRKALEMDPTVRRAHYYLGTVAASDPTGTDPIETAIAELREELKVAEDDPLVLDQLGTQLIEAGRPEEAVPVLESAVRVEPRALYVYDLGRALLGAGRAGDAVAAQRRALHLATEQGGGEVELEKIHYQLGIALSRQGAAAEAKRHLDEAKRLSARWTDASRRVTTLGPAGAAGARPGFASTAVAEASPLARLPEAQRRDLAGRVRSSLAQAYLNLGVMQARQQQLARAAELFGAASELSPDFPGVQYALGVARFNTGEFDKATQPLSRAFEGDPGNADLRRMLAMAWLQQGAHAKAASLLEGDPQLSSNPDLRLALGMAYRGLGQNGKAQEQFAAYEKLTGKRPF